MNLPPLVRFLLWPLSIVYGGYVRLRAGLYEKGWLKQKHLRGKVISVGNLTVGGTGKTPMVLWLAQKFLAEGKRVAILSRGYRGSGGTSDEIELMKHRLQGRVTFGVGKDRFAKGHGIEQQEVIDIFLLDDGFQHLPLARDLDILLMDASRPVHRSLLLPAGSLREPVSSMTRADLLVFTRVETQTGTVEAIGKLGNYPVFAAVTRLVGFRLHGDAALLQAREIGAGPFFAFCGIGNPEAFLRDLQSWALPLAGKMFFADHHCYTPSDVKALEEAAQAAGAKAFVTTEKDVQNLSSVKFKALSLYVAVIDLEVKPGAEFLAAIDSILHAKSGAPA
ncbi:MAG: tetraacyldisaccharide 4'-kinase [Candidatus Acidiferrales bacterium]